MIKKIGNSPKRSRKENNPSNIAKDTNKELSSNKMDLTNLDEVASQDTIEDSMMPITTDRGLSNRLNFINAQKKIDILLLIIPLIWYI